MTTAANPGEICDRFRACMAYSTLLEAHDGTLICPLCGQRADRAHDPRVPKARRMSTIPKGSSRRRPKPAKVSAFGRESATRITVTRMPSHPLAHSQVWW